MRLGAITSGINTRLDPGGGKHLRPRRTPAASARAGRLSSPRPAHTRCSPEALTRGGSMPARRRAGRSFTPTTRWRSFGPAAPVGSRRGPSSTTPTWLPLAEGAGPSAVPATAASPRSLCPRGVHDQDVGRAGARDHHRGRARPLEGGGGVAAHPRRERHRRPGSAVPIEMTDEVDDDPEATPSMTVTSASIFRWLWARRSAWPRVDRLGSRRRRS